MRLDFEQQIALYGPNTMLEFDGVRGFYVGTKKSGVHLIAWDNGESKAELNASIERMRRAIDRDNKRNS